MDFQQAFLNAIQTNTTLSKNNIIQKYLPTSLSTPISIVEDLPYVQAYGNVFSSYPYNYEMSYLDSYCFIYTENGIGNLIYDNRSYKLVRNTLAFIDCHEAHRIEVLQSPWNYKVFFIKGNPVPFLHSTLVHNYGNLHTFPFGSSAPTLLLKFFTHLDRNSDKAFLQTKFIIDILLEVILEKDRIESTDTHISEYLIEIKHEFDSNYQGGFSLAALEHKFHISKYRICREFTEQFHSSPIHYLNQKRIEAAKESLLYSDKRINEIGRLVGFENTNHFIRLFKQQTGVTPLVFRKKPPAHTFFNE